MEEGKKKLNKWELARYLIDAKKSIDSILFIEDNKQALLNIGIREEVESRRQQFYINCGEVLDARFSKKKNEKFVEAMRLYKPFIMSEINTMHIKIPITIQKNMPPSWKWQMR